MGFSFKKMFSGSGWKKFKGVVGGVLKVATSVIPGVGGLAGKAAGALLGAKAVKSVGGLVDKLGGVNKLANLAKNGRPSTGMILKMSPVLPGGAVATPGGAMPWSPNVAPPMMYGTTRAAAPRRKRKKKAAPRRTVRSTTKRKRTTKGRLPKFGSPAWRKKFGLDKKKRKKRAK